MHVFIFARTALTFASLLIGFWLVLAARRAFAQACRMNRLVTSGPYNRIRHPQYLGFISITLAAVLLWPTIAMLMTLIVVAIACVLLARRDEREAELRFGQEYRRYAERTPGFIPHL